jgi:glycosyltransferase involved in cell wall biosynthesis
VREAEKLLSVAVPAYNAERTLPACLDSLVASPALGRLDIIVINDGSRDGTGAVAGAYARRFAGSVRVVHQENGGHGAGINAAAPLAGGKYFKVLDADDRLLTENLPALLDALRAASADAVVTPFRTVNGSGRLLHEYAPAGVTPGREYAFEDFWNAGRGVRRCCTFHGLTYRTDFYRSCGIRLSEHTFYEDQEYATLPFRQVRSVLPLGIPLYEYRLGVEGQSMSDASQVRHLADLERVFWVIWEGYRTLPGEEEARGYFRCKLAELLLSYYAAALLKNPDRAGGRGSARALREHLRAQDADFARYTARGYRLVLALHRFGFGRVWNAVRRLPGYRTVSQWAHC